MSRIAVSIYLVFSLYLIGLNSAQNGNEGVTIHVVQRGETLYKIALQYGISMGDLARGNGIVNPGNIQVGQRLLVPTGDNVSLVTAQQTHVVRPGDTLQTIAVFYGTTVQDLIRINEISNPNAIYVGQTLRLVAEADSAAEQPAVNSETLTTLPPPTFTPAPVSVSVASAAVESPTSVVHVIKPGETLFRIATQYGVSVNDLVRANSIADPTVIYAGQRLIISGSGAVADVEAVLPEPFVSIDVAPRQLVEGKTARFRVITREPSLLSAQFLDREVSIASEADNTSHTILQGIPLFTAPGIYPFAITAVATGSGTTASHTMNLQITAGPYGREYIQLLAGRGGLLEPAVEEAEMNLLKAVMAQFTPTRHFAGPMGLPAAARIISPFGTRRSYNGGPFDRFHSGTDFAGAPGTPVLATAPGRVVLADTLNVRGIATVIDHGWGIYTGYWHQAQQYVSVGDWVTAGQVIGTIGSTGRVTGAHLHWELWVNGVAVDPMQWVQFSFG
jgi:murein DD-endopeptidase MepM/ murein hydrolase activator NlpD